MVGEAEFRLSEEANQILSPGCPTNAFDEVISQNRTYRLKIKPRQVHLQAANSSLFPLIW